jgi:hypothetical protein
MEWLFDLFSAFLKYFSAFAWRIENRNANTKIKWDIRFIDKSPFFSRNSIALVCRAQELLKQSLAC